MPTLLKPANTLFLKQYKHIFFDLDHTLWDFDRNSAKTLERLYNEYSLDERGIELTPFLDVYEEHNQRMWERFRKGLLRREELRWKRFWVTLLDFKVVSETLAHELSSAYLEILPTQTLLMPHAKEVLDHFRENNYQLHLITNGFEMTQKMKLQFSGLGGYFNEIVTSEKSYAMKPHPNIFDYALKATGATVDDCIMIGDALEIDVVGAQEAGWDQVYYNPARLEHTRKPTFEVSCLSELKEIL